MACWITIHYPHPDDDTLPWVVYLQTEAAARNLFVGDAVLFVCQKYPPKIDMGRGPESVFTVQRTTGSESETIQLERTAGGVVGIATISGRIRPKQDSTASEFEYGNSEKWPYFVDCANFVRGQEVVTSAQFKGLTGKGIAWRSRYPYQIDRGAFERVVEAMGLDPATYLSRGGIAGAPQSFTVSPTVARRSEAQEVLDRCGVPDVERLFARIHHAQSQSERNVEDVVKSFLLTLGHDEFRLTFQRGHIDLRVDAPGGGTRMIVEVKKELDSAREQARRQGFDYALQTDAELVVLTDANAYEIYERSRAGGYDQMRAGRFRLTEFSEKDMGLLDMLRPK